MNTGYTKIAADFYCLTSCPLSSNLYNNKPNNRFILVTNAKMYLGMCLYNANKFQDPSI